jgi:arginyl-tRNA synthetase
MKILSHDPIKNSISAIISDKITQLWSQNLPASEIYSQLSDVPDLSKGHIAFGCFPLAKQFKLNPAQASQMLAQSINEMPNPIVASVISVGPYLNFFLKTSAIDQFAINDIIQGSYFKRKLLDQTPKTMIEFSQPNTHKELHVGHMRNLCLGDALVRMHRYVGFELISSTFPGDVGTHVAKCLWYMKKFVKNTDIPATRKGAWLGEMYSKANNLLEDQLGSDQEEKNRAELTLILKQLEHKNGEYYELWKETRQWSIDLMQEVYQWANVKFDMWYFESDVDSESVKLVKKYFEQGLFKEDQGAIGIDLSDDGLGFCLLIKSDGNGLYATKDIELARRKFEDYKIEKNIYVVDKRQAHHFRQVFKTLEKMGFKQAKDCFHLQYDFVELPDGAMSSRKGNIVPLQSLVDQMVAHIKSNYLNKYAGEWSEQEINKVANQVAQGAIKYGMNAQDTNKKIVFKMEDWLRLDGESGPYLQYSCARINALLAKIDEKFDSADLNCLNDPHELALMIHLIKFNDVLIQSTLHYKPSSLCTYLYDLAKLFNSFYANCPINKADMPVKLARAKLARAVQMTLTHGLALLGIPAPEKM